MNSAKSKLCLYYHPESDCYFWDSIDMDRSGELAMCDDVTGCPEHEQRAKEEGVFPPGEDK